VLPRIQALVAKRPTYGYRRITALLNRELRALGLPPVNHKRVYRIMAPQQPTAAALRIRAVRAQP